jgi:hypothetical protein
MNPRQTKPPPGPDAGAFTGAEWEWAHQEPPPHRPPAPDLSALIALLESLRRMIPAELQEQFNALQRELLLTVRGLIDWQLERLEAGKPESQVEDIPIE